MVAVQVVGFGRRGGVSIVSTPFPLPPDGQSQTSAPSESAPFRSALERARGRNQSQHVLRKRPALPDDDGMVTGETAESRPSRNGPCFSARCGITSGRGRSGTRHHRRGHCARPRRTVHSRRHLLGGGMVLCLVKPLPAVEHHLRALEGTPHRFRCNRVHLDPLSPPQAPRRR
jgi:hypothetical protein